MRTTSVTVGPLAAASANNICLSQKGPGAFDLAIDGTLSGGGLGYVANNICLSQSVASATTMLINGSLAQSGVAYFQGTNKANVVIVSAGNDTGITFTVFGTDANGYAAQTEVVTGANTSRVSTVNVFSSVISITTSGATAAAVTVGTNAQYAKLDMPRRILFTSAGNDSGITTTVTGTDWNGNAATEVLTLANASTVYTVYDYATVTSMKLSGATASTITVGTNGIASSMPILLDEFAPAPTALQVVATGTVNYTVRQTLDQPSNWPSTSLAYTGLTWTNHPDATLVSATGTVQGNYAYVPKMTQILLNSGTGTVVFKAIQAGSIAFP